ncbi:MAG TPA: tetratricopeptide repeat protein [Mycobacteriales bacterium]|nr:tetratricopeptide repeat protein [Mycobacteriales bacterium]
MQRPPSDLALAGSLAGAVDLSGLAARPAQPSGGKPASTSAHVFDVSELDFEDLVLRRSLQVPVLVDFWADWCGPCKQLTPVLERLAEEAGGSWVLAKVDTDANQALAGQLQIQSIPSVFLALGGRLIPGFQGALPEAQLRAFLEQVLAAAEQAGLTGPGEGAPEPGEPAADPDLVAAEEALAREDYEAAVAAYDGLLARAPGDPEATLGRAWALLLKRAAHLDVPQVLAAAQARPDDVDSQLAAADVEVLSEHLQEAIDRVVGLVRRTAGEDRDRARLHLLELFSVLDPEDERVLSGRRALANALY